MPNEIKNISQTEIVLYQPDESTRLEVRLEDDTVWLTQAQMSELFQTTRNNITLHVRNIFKEGELSEFSVCKESLLTASDGKRYNTKFYNLDGNESHDRWLIIDDSLYHCGHSLNAMGNKMSAITLMGIAPDAILSQIR